jgi:hypothetical protein
MKIGACKKAPIRGVKGFSAWHGHTITSESTVWKTLEKTWVWNSHVPILISSSIVLLMLGIGIHPELLLLKECLHPCLIHLCNLGIIPLQDRRRRWTSNMRSSLTKWIRQSALFQYTMITAEVLRIVQVSATFSFHSYFLMNMLWHCRGKKSTMKKGKPFHQFQRHDK